MPSKTFRAAALPLALALALSAQSAAAQTIPLTGGAYAQDFDTLSNTTGSTTNSALPAGWMLIETGGGARDNEQYAVDTGASNSGDTYSYGTAGSTERALGSLRSGTLVSAFGACFGNATGGTLTSLDVGYTGEQWRLGTAARADTLQLDYSLDATSLTTGTWVRAPALDFTTPNTATVGAKDGNAAGNRAAINGTLQGLSIANGSTVCLRWSDIDGSGADDGLAIDDVRVTVAAGSGQPVIAVSDARIVEGDSGLRSLQFGFGLDRAGSADVTFDVSTADGTAQAGSDYDALATTVTIPAGQTSATVAVPVIGDTAQEPDETLFVNISNVVGAIVSDGQGLGTIENDDVVVTPIHAVQGSGALSPFNGQQITVEGIVTAQKFNNGFFLQTADADIDADPATSQGIFVFTSTAPPASAAIGNRVRVSGTVTEFTPSTNLNQRPITEIVSVTQVQVVAGSQPLPAAVVLDASSFGAGATVDTAEKFEGMRVSVPQATVIAASEGNISEGAATSSTTGVFHVTLPGVARPFREPGLSVMDNFPVPAGKTPPRFDANPERLMVRSRGLVGATAVALDVGAQVTGMTGVMDYFGGTWALLPDAGTVNAAGGMTGTPVADAKPEDVTIGGFNLLRFFDEVNDSNGAPTLQAAALDKRLTKTSIAICDSIKAPDILGVVEVENLRVLGLLADRINATCARGPAYVPYLVQGNDPGGINVGYLVSNRSVGAGSRVEVLEVTQYGKTTLFTNPDNSTALLNDRPPLLMRARVHQANGASFPVTLIVNHLRSLNGVDDTAAGSSGWATEGHRVRAKRQQQAEFLARMVEDIQTANPDEQLVLMGDFNAFEFNDGYGDSMGTIRGEPTPEEQVVLASPDLVTADLIDGAQLIADPAQHYSYVFEGNAQTLDHVLVNEPIAMGNDVRVDHARINADFGVHHFGTAGTPLRTSDHDPVRVAISVPGFRTADLSASVAANLASARAGQVVRFTANAGNAGPNAAESMAVAFAFDALLSPSMASVPAGWTCGAPAQDATTTTVTCTIASLASGGSATFAIDAVMPARSAPLNLAVAARSQVTDGANGNNQAMASVAPIVDTADMGVSINALGMRGQLSSFSVPVSNAGPDAAAGARVVVQSPAPASYVSVNAPTGWTCVRASQATHRTECARAQAMPSGVQQVFGVGIVQPRATPGSIPHAFSVQVSSTALDPQSGNNAASYGP